MKRKLISFFVPFAIVLAFDQIIKYKIRLLGGFYICNQGISFSLKLPHLIYLVIFIFIILCLLFFRHYFLKPYNLFRTLAAACFFAGAFSNIFDRLFHSCVIDYIHFSNYLPVINLADIAIFCGISLFTLNYVNK